MKKVFAVVLLLTMNAMAGDLTGKWSGSFKVDGADHDVPQLFIFKQDGNKLTGSGGPDQSEQYPIEDARVDGERLTFAITTGEWKFTYSLRATDSKLAGDLELKSVNSRRTAKVNLSRTQ
jgi:outer membrane cobalamin receptor